MSTAPIVDRIRIIPRPVDFLNRNVGASGEVFFNRETNSLRVYSGNDRSGFEIARADLENVSDATLTARIEDLGIVGSGGGGASVDVGITAPQTPESGNLWLNTENGKLYIYINDGDSSQWIQPAFPTFSGSYTDLTNIPSFAAIATSGSYNDLTDKPTFTDTGFDGSYTSLTNLPTSFSNLTELSLASGQTINEFSNDSTLADNSSSAVPTELAVKTYVDTQISSLTSIEDFTLTGTTTIQQTTEVLNNIVGATGTVAHDFELGAVYNHTSIAGNFIVNFINVPTTNDRTISTVLLLNQGNTPYMSSGCQIEGVTQTINWIGGSTPSGTSNKLDIVSFTLIRTGGNWTVIASANSYG